MKELLLSLSGNEVIANSLGACLELEQAEFELRRFPDGESYVRIDSPVSGRKVIVVCGLERPDEKLLPLYFCVQTLRELGATSIGLVAPYLSYMRQDRRFHEGEGVTSRYFARLLSDTFDWLVTVDPHLHRYSSLDEIYSMPAEVVHAAPVISEWVRSNIPQALLIGPDSESEQWVGEVAKMAGVPHVVLSKTRHGDRDVEVSIPKVEQWKSYTPVLVDDIISTARTMIETVGHLKQLSLKAPVCVGIHAIFAQSAFEDLLEAGVSQVTTCNTIPHESNAIDISMAIAKAAKQLINQ